MTDDRFETELRAALADRAPTGASPALAVRLRAIPVVAPQTSAGWLPRFGRGLAGLAVTVAAIAVLVVLTAQAGLRLPDPDGAGASPLPVVPAPHVRAVDGFFTATAMAEAESRLRAVAEAYGVDASFVVQAEDRDGQLSTPLGWPEAFDHGGHPDRDILAVVGIDPNGHVVCCLTILGEAADAAQDSMTWRPLAHPTNLDRDLSSRTIADRDAALARFVSGIEGFAPAVAATTPDSTIWSSWWLVLALGAILGLVVVGRRRVALATGGSSAAPMSVPLGAAADERSGDPAPLATSGATAASVAGAVPSVTWTAAPDTRWDRALARIDRHLSWLAAALLAAWLVLIAVPMVLPPPPGVALNPSTDGQGIALPGVPALAAVLVGGALVAIAVEASRGGWRRRAGTVAVVGLVAAIIIPAVAGARPELGAVYRPWAMWPAGATVDRDGVAGLIEVVTVPLDPADPFAVAFEINNPSALPMTILGVRDPQGAIPAIVAASPVSIGRVPDPRLVRGEIAVSARPEDVTVSWPVTIEPGGHLIVTVLLRAGPCAMPGGTGGVLPVTSVPLVYSVLGIERSADVGLPAVFFVAAEDGCRVEFPGGAITF